MTNLGKFEREPAWVEYFWNLALEGEGETFYKEPESEFDDEPNDARIGYDQFVVDAAESERFGVPIGSIVRVAEDNNGFVYGSIQEPS